MSGYTQLTPRQRYQIELYRNEYQLSQAEIARRLQTAFYFARPYAAWQRGSNENANA